MSDAKKIKEYIKHIVDVARVLTKDLPRKHECREFLKINIEGEWKEFQNGVKTLEEIERKVVDIFYTVFPQHRENDTIPSFAEFLSGDKVNEKCNSHSNKNVVTQERRDMPRKGHNIESARIESRKRKRGSTYSEIDSDQIDKEKSIFGHHQFLEDFTERSKGSCKKRKQNEFQMARGNERNNEEGEEFVTTESAESQGMLKRSVLIDIVSRAMNRNGLSVLEKNALDFLDFGVRLRLWSVLMDLKNFSKIRQNNHEVYITKLDENRVNTLLSIERGNDQRIAMTKSTGQESERKDAKLRQRRVSLTDKNKLKKDEILKLQRWEAFYDGRRDHLQSYVEKKTMQRRKYPCRAEVRKISNIKTFKKLCKSSTSELEKGTGNSENSVPCTKHVKGSFYSKKSVTRLDCDLLMEFDPQLRKSCLRFKWMSRF